MHITMCPRPFDTLFLFRIPKPQFSKRACNQETLITEYRGLVPFVF